MTQQDTTKLPQKPKTYFKLKIFIWVTTIFVFVISATTAYFCFYEYKNLTQQNQTLQLKINALSLNLAKTLQNQQTIQDAVKKLRQNSNMSYYINLLSTTDQIVTAADLSIKNENNIARAIELINVAIDRIHDIHEFAPITQSLENNVATLKSTTTLAPEKIIMQLDKIAQQVNTLTQVLATPNKTTQTTTPATVTTTEEQTPSSFGKFMNNIGQALHNVIIISHKKNVPIALTSSQLINLKLNLHTLVLNTILAVNKHQPNIYQTNLKEMADLLQTYFAANEEVQNNILPTIQQLQKIDLKVENTTLESSLQLIETTLKQKSIADIPPLTF